MQNAPFRHTRWPWWALALVLLSAVVGLAQAAPDQAATRRDLEQIIAYVDSAAYAAEVNSAEHIVLTYQLVRGRAPTPLEFFLITEYARTTPILRSTVLSFVLRGQEPGPTWAQAAAFTARVKPADFRLTPGVRQLAVKLSATPPAEIAREAQARLALDRPVDSAVPLAQSLAMPQPNVVYNVYYGYLHAHSQLSDGEGTPLEAYTYARQQGGLDFFSLTDHGELMQLWPWQNRWQQLKDAAAATYQPNTYVTLWGFEWSNPILGHMNLINTDDYTSFLTDFRLSSVFDWLAARPAGFGRFNHPGDYNYLRLEFRYLQLYPAAVGQMAGIETWNGSSSFDTYYYDGSWENDYSYWDVGNQNGWYLGALGGQDNHSPNWGTRNDFRTAVLAEHLTREEIVAAYQQRRFYATEDKDLSLDFRSNGYPMGARLTGLPRTFDITACDGSGDIFQMVRLFRNGDLLASQAVDGNCVNATFSDNATSPAYYYVIVTETDDNDGNDRPDEALSSPIWFDSN